MRRSRIPMLFILTLMIVATVTVVDTTPPELTMSLSPDELWPPNHQMMDVTATVVATDNCGPPAVPLRPAGVFLFVV